MSSRADVEMHYSSNEEDNNGGSEEEESEEMVVSEEEEDESDDTSEDNDSKESDDSDDEEEMEEDYEDDNDDKPCYYCSSRFNFVPKGEKFTPQSNVHHMAKERFKLFKAQDANKGCFDVTFDIGGKKLHAHKFMLTISEPLTSLISGLRPAKKDKSIKIEKYSYEPFYQLLCFLYSGECQLIKENVLVLMDMAEFYGIPLLKGFCDQWLTDKKDVIDEKNIYEFVEMANQHSMKDFLSMLEKFFNRNFKALVGDEKFLGIKKEVMEILSKFKRNKGKKEEKFFEAIYKWGVHQATAAVGAKADENIFHEAIDNELNGILSNLDYSKMRLHFVLSFIISDKCFLFTAAELYKILLKSKKRQNREEKFFKVAYKLAKREALENQETTPVKNFNLAFSILTELAEILPEVKFYQMSDQFLIDFVAAKGILSHDQALHVKDINVQIRNGERILTGSFKDDFKIFDRVPTWEDGFTKIKHKITMKQRFSKLKCEKPKTRSTVTRMKGIEWFLCLERDGVVTVKFHKLLDDKLSMNDYLLTELKPANNTKFRIDLNRFTYISATHNKIF